MPQDHGPQVHIAEPATPPRGAAHAYAVLRKLGGHAYQLRAAVRAADHFMSQDNPPDRNTGSWLISSAFGIAEELAGDLDGLAKSLRDRPGDTTLRGVRTRAHQLHAATRAADHFLDQESNDDRSTGSWLVTYALGLASKLAAELDDVASKLQRVSNDAATAPADPVTGWRASIPAALRDVAA